MKKIFTIVLAAAALVSCDNGTKYTISGSDAAFEDGKMAYIIKMENRKMTPVDSVAVKNNSFKFKGEAPETPYSGYIAVGSSNLREAAIRVPVYVEAGKIAINVVDAEKKNFTATGSPLNDAYTEFNNKMEEIYDRMGKAHEAKDDAGVQAAQKEVAELRYNTIINNAANQFGSDQLSRSYYQFEPQQLLDIIAAMPAEKQEKMADMKKGAEQALKVAPGNPYIDITEPTPDGKQLSLKSAVENKKNKYILLDFWASWCGPCMMEVPHLKTAYDKYHKKGFEIYAVSLDQNRENWEKAIKDKKMNWLHVSNVKYWDTQSRNDYAVNSIPANFLIDCSTGKIVAKGLRGAALEEKLAELLK